jgi:heme/copper-type cytochrome/quinol oxidase subunit 2
MEIPKKFLHDRTVLLLITLISLVVVIGVSVVLLRFDASKNPTTTVAYRPSIVGSQYQSGKPIDIYSMAVYMLITAVLGVFLSARIYKIRHYLSIFLLSSTALLLILAIRVSWSLINLQ